MQNVSFTEHESLWGTNGCTHGGCDTQTFATLRNALTRWLPEDASDVEVECADHDGNELFICLAATRTPDEATLRAEWGFPRDFEGESCACGAHDASKELPLVMWQRAFRLQCTKASAVRLLECVGAQRIANHVAGRFGC